MGGWRSGREGGGDLERTPLPFGVILQNFDPKGSFRAEGVRRYLVELNGGERRVFFSKAKEDESGGEVLSGVEEESGRQPAELKVKVLVEVKVKGDYRHRKRPPKHTLEGRGVGDVGFQRN